MRLSNKKNYWKHKSNLFVINFRIIRKNNQIQSPREQSISPVK
jgi:hypothetical protein